MASYKMPCVHCGKLVDRDVRYCPYCGAVDAFGDSCPACLRPVTRDMQICPGCGRPLYTLCPHCGKPTFVQQVCESCGGPLMVRCENSRCGRLQFFENKKCTACGKKIKYRK